MARGDKNYDDVVRKVNDGQTADAKIKAIHKMIESLISEDSDSANEALHTYLQAKMRQMILGEEPEEAEEELDEMERSKQFANSGTVMDDDVKGDIKFDNGGKKTLKKHGNAPKELDDDKLEKVKFKHGGKKTLKKHGNAPAELDDDKLDHFDDGRDRDLGTAKS